MKPARRTAPTRASSRTAHPTRRRASRSRRAEAARKPERGILSTVALARRPKRNQFRDPVPGQNARPNQQKGVLASTGSLWETWLCELEFRLTQLETENRALRAACQQLEASSALHARLRDLAPAGLVELDEHGMILNINRAGAALLGREKTQLARRRFTVLVEPEDLPKFIAHLRRCLRSRKVVSSELNLRGAGGETMLVELASVPALNPDSRVTHLETTLIDVTRRKRAEAALLTGERELRTLIEASPHPIQLKDATARWQVTNHAALELFELTGVDYRNKRDAELAAHSPFYRAVLEAREHKDRAVLESGKPTRGDEIIRKPDGSTRILDVIRIPLLLDDARPKGLVVLSYDITERARAEEALRAQEARLQFISDTTPVMLTQCSRDLRYRFVNRAYAAMLGLAPEQILGKPIVEIMGAAGFDAIRPYVETVLQGRPVEWEQTVPYARIGPRCLHVAYTPVTGEQGNVHGWVASLSDISDRKRAEEALRESEARFRNLADAAPVLIWMAGLDKKCTYFNQRWLEFTGRTLEQELGDGWAEGVHPDDLQRCRETYVASFDARREFRMEYRLRRHDGEYRWILGHGVPRVSGPNEFVGYIGTCIDTTERRRAEDALRQARDELERRVRARTAALLRANAALQSEIAERKEAGLARVRLAAIVESSADAILSEDLDGAITSWNRGAERVFGYAAAEIVGRSFLVLVPADRADEEREVRERLRRGELVEPFETVRLRKDGSPIEVSVVISPVRDAAGHVSGASVIARDISQRRQMEAALRTNEAKFRGFVESAPDGVVIVDYTGRIYLVNARTERLFGYSRKELEGQPMELLMPKRYHERYRGHRQNFFAQARTRSMGSGLELFGRRKDGSEFPVEVSLSPLQTEEGVLVSAAIRDITERKRAEKALRESEARLQAIMDHSPSLIFLKDRAGRYLHFNRRFEQTFQLPLDQTVGKTDAEIFPAKQAAAFRANDLKVIETAEAIQFDETARHDDGLHTSIVTKFPLYDADGKVHAVGGIVTDITERRRLETEIVRISEREQRRIAQDLHDGLGQQLAGITCLSNVLKQDLAEQASPEADTAARISKLLEVTVMQTRSLSQGLYPVAPEPGGLMSALEDFADNVASLFKVSCRFVCRQPVLVEDNAAATHLYRIAQEAVTNALKHGRARRIRIGLSSTPERIVLMVSNNGVPLTKAAPQRKGLGLRIMNHRAEMIGGTLVFQRPAAGGTEVVCTVPRTDGSNARGG